MTKLTANIILLGMFGVWAYLSVIKETLYPVSDNFILLALALSSAEGAEFLSAKYKEFRNGKSNSGN